MDAALDESPAPFLYAQSPKENRPRFPAGGLVVTN
jgi:hypothetical protein